MPMNEHAISVYLLGLVDTRPEDRAVVLAGLREHGRDQLADAAAEMWAAMPETTGPKRQVQA